MKKIFVFMLVSVLVGSACAETGPEDAGTGRTGRTTSILRSRPLRLKNGIRKINKRRRVMVL